MMVNTNDLGLCNRDLVRRFDRAAAGFDDVDFVHTVTRDGLLGRLQPLRIEAKAVVDLGCATGSACRALARRFRDARIIGIDLSHAMLQELQQKQPMFRKVWAVQADATRLPLEDHSVDVCFANLLLPWIDDPQLFFAEVARVLREDGLLLFATLGPDSLHELRRAWQAADDGHHVNRFLDMHDVGDAAVRARLKDPVLDVDRLTVTYADPAALFRDLTAIGGRNSLRARGRSLVSRERFSTMTRALDTMQEEGRIALNLELVYGHCWGPGALARRDEFRLDPAQIGMRR